MKPLLLAIGLFPTVLFGQITLNVSDFSDGGDAVWMSTTVDPTLDFSSTGPNSTWDYSTLVYQNQEYKEYFDMSGASILVNILFGTFASTDYQATNYTSSSAIPLDQISGVLPVSITDVFQLSKNSSDSITSVGFSLAVEGTEVPFKSDTIETRYKLPLNYGDSYSSRGYSNMDMNPIYNGIWRQYRQRYSTVDGWGTITTPYGTFDALRIDHLIQESDSIFMELFGAPLWIPLPIPDRHEYEWWTNGEKEPVLRITTSVIVGNETVTNIEYRDNYQGSNAGLEELGAEITLFPNPVTNELHVNGLDAEIVYMIVSANGNQVDGGQVNGNNGVVDVAQLTPGSYTFFTFFNNQVSSSTFIKK